MIALLLLAVFTLLTLTVAAGIAFVCLYSAVRFTTRRTVN